jgi:ribonuclease-3
MNRTESLKEIQTRLEYSFKDITLLEEALTHDSNRVNDRNLRTYQRLEFLGDSVLSLIITDYLFRTYPNSNEGELTIKRKEWTESLKQSQIAEKLNIKEHISFGQSVNRALFSKYHSFVESLIGAVYIDGGLDAAKQVINRLWELRDNSGAANTTSNCVMS